MKNKTKYRYLDHGKAITVLLLSKKQKYYLKGELIGKHEPTSSPRLAIKTAQQLALKQLSLFTTHTSLAEN